MPPRKLTEEQKIAAFDNWKNSDEYAKIWQFATTGRSSTIPIEMGTKDIVDKWDTFLNELYDLTTTLKVPGRKVKSKTVTLISVSLGYEQQYVRTMFLEKCEKKTIDGVTYEISNSTQVEIWNCKGKLVELFNTLDPSMMEMQLTHETYVVWKKDLVKMLKEWDKLYTKHIKSGFVEMNAIHTTAMRPLIELLESNLNLHHLELLMKKKDVPTFRFDALEEKFAGHLTRVCEIFRDYGILKEQFNIKQMLHIMKIEGWRECPPLCFYLNPLSNALTDMRECLLKMNQEGILHCKYIVEENEELQLKTQVMVQKDLTVQWLAGDELKQDQFKFMYQVMKIIYDSALRDMMLNEDPKVLDNVLPSLASYQALLLIKQITTTKEAERRKELEKLQRDGGAGSKLRSSSLEEKPTEQQAQPQRHRTMAP
jgi:hypothetical protein